MNSSEDSYQTVSVRYLSEMHAYAEGWCKAHRKMSYIAAAGWVSAVVAIAGWWSK